MKFDQQQIYRKKLLYQSCNRGLKENDLILGNFAKKHVLSMDLAELKEFEKILNYSDHEIYDYYSKKQEIPHHKNSLVLQKILNFKSL